MFSAADVVPTRAKMKTNVGNIAKHPYRFPRSAPIKYIFFDENGQSLAGSHIDRRYSVEIPIAVRIWLTNHSASCLFLIVVPAVIFLPFLHRKRMS